MDEKAIRRAALITLHRAICKRFPAGRERNAWLAWAERMQRPALEPAGRAENL
jgi:hypothetical protein